MGPKFAGLTPSSDLEFTRGPNFFVLGFDEVGVGCLAGPVVAACFAYRPDEFTWDAARSPRIIDSKKLGDKARAEASLALSTAPHAVWAIAEATPAEIDAINILKASQLAMERAFREVARKLGARGVRGTDCVALVDGNRRPAFLEKCVASCETLVKGDARSFAIAAASILAKEHRDTLMVRLGEAYPDYGWQQNVGYPTPPHKAAILQHGPTIHHRRSYRLIPDTAECPRTL